MKKEIRSCLLHIRPVWPALLCIIGTAPVALAFGYIATFNYFSTSYGDSDPSADAIGLLLPAVWLLTISLLLLLDAARKTIWGILAAATFGLATEISFLGLGQILSSNPVANLNWTLAPLLAGPILGLAGAVWALLWKLPLRQSQAGFDSGRSLAKRRDRKPV